MARRRHPRPRGPGALRHPRPPRPPVGVRQGPQGADQVLLDPNPLSPDHTISVRLLDVSLDGSCAVIGTRHGGEDELEVSFKDVATGRDLPDRLPKARYFSVSITPDKA